METVQRDPELLCGFRAVSRDLSDLAYKKKKTPGSLWEGGYWRRVAISRLKFCPPTPLPHPKLQKF